jgi:MFS transporter, DHA1 family, tetracycline resistance protein
MSRSTVQTEVGDYVKDGLPVVAFIVFIDMVGVGLIIPVMPALIEGLTGGNIGSSARIAGLLLFSYAAMQFMFAPMIGALSDRFGRRPILLITLILMGLDYFIMALAPSLAWLFVGRILSGIFGATYVAANSCVADAVPETDRAKAFGILGAAAAGGLICGPAIGGLLAQFGDRVAFWAAGSVALAGSAIGFFKIRETLSRENRRKLDFRNANPFGVLMSMVSVREIRPLLVVIFLVQLAAQVQISVLSFYTILKFDWSPALIGFSMACAGILAVIVQGGLVGSVVQRLGEYKTGLIALVVAIPTYIIFAFASATWVIFVGIAIGAIVNFVGPAIQSAMTRRVDSQSQGKLQGAVASTVAATQVIGPLAMSWLFFSYSDSVGVYLPGAPYIAAAFISLIAVIVFIGARKAFPQIN